MSIDISSYSEVNILQTTTCTTDSLLSRDFAQLMQIVNEMTWIVLESSDERDPYKVSIFCYFLSKPLRAQPFRGLLRCSNLVDPASSHMLVSKIKPCMCKYKYYTAKLRMAH